MVWSSTVIKRPVSFAWAIIIRKNPKSQEQLINDAQYCSQKLFEFVLDESQSVVKTILLSYRNGRLISTLRGFFGKQEVIFDGFAGLEQFTPYIEKYMEEVYERRKEMGKL